MKLLRSIRWRLPMTYASIAIFTSVVLGGILLITLEDYYAARERDYLATNSQTIQRRVEEALINETEDIETQLNNLAFISRTTIALSDAAGQTLFITDSSVEGILFPRVPWANKQQPDDIEFSGPVTRAITGGSLWLRSTSFGYQLTYEEPMPNQTSDQTLVLPLYDNDGELLGHLRFADGPAFGREIVGDVADRLEIAGGLAVLLAIVAGLLVSRNISRPVMALTQVTRQMAGGDLSVRCDLQRGDELGSLACSFNTMAQRIEATITALQRFVADAAHELHTPITALHTNLELAVTETNPTAAQLHLQQAQTQLTRLEMLATSLLDLTRLETQNIKRAPVDFTKIIQRSHERYASQAEQANIDLEFILPNDPIMIEADEAQLVQVVDNLLDNALKFTPSAGAVTVGIENQHAQLRFWIKDSGIGILPGDLPNLFSRFHRGRNAASYPGNGLGLVIVKTIVEQHRGRVEVESNESGTCFSVHLPLRMSP